MERIWIEYVGLAAGALTTAAYLPQVYKTWRTKAVENISLVMYTSMSLGVLLWLVYGILIKAPAVIAANGVSLALVGGMLRMKIKYGRKTPGQIVSSDQARGGAPGPPARGSAPGPRRGE
jgi:MtN3 and saliva related transmembrane protein